MAKCKIQVLEIIPSISWISKTCFSFLRICIKQWSSCDILASPLKRGMHQGHPYP